MLAWLRRRVDKQFNNLWVRSEFVESCLNALPVGSRLLDAGAGGQQFKKVAAHLHSVSQDFTQNTADETSSFAGGLETYEYGQTDIVGDIWDIDVPDESFDAVLCTEVLEHVAYPQDTIRELSRVLRVGGTLVLTAPSNCLRHFDPYYFSSGYSDRFYEEILPKFGLRIDTLVPVGDYFSWLKVEMFRSIVMRPLSGFLLLPALLYFWSRRSTPESQATLCRGYNLDATKV